LEIQSELMDSVGLYADQVKSCVPTHFHPKQYRTGYRCAGV